MYVFLHNDTVAVVAVGKALFVAATFAAGAAQSLCEYRNRPPYRNPRNKRLLQDLAEAVAIATFHPAGLHYNTMHRNVNKYTNVRY